MKKNTLIIIVLLFIIENIILFYVINVYTEQKQFKTLTRQSEGLVQVCKHLTISENLFSAIEKLQIYSPQISVSYDNIYLSFQYAKRKSIILISFFLLVF